MAKHRHSVFSMAWLLFCVLVSRVLVDIHVRIIRLPFTMIGKKYVTFGRGLSVGRRLRIECLSEKSRLVFGRNVKLNDDVHIGCIDVITIGNNVLVGSKVLITDHQHGSYSGAVHSNPDIPPDNRPLSSAPVSIEDNVWIGEMVSILPGVTIGFGAIIGAGSVVTKDVPALTISVGTPCRPVKKYCKETGQWENI